MKGVLRAKLLGLVLLLAASSAHANLITNGGFETGDLTGWTVFGNPDFIGVGGFPHSGSHAAYFGPVGSDGGIRQSVATTPGTTYDLSLWLRNLGGTPNDFSALVDGVSFISLTNAPAVGYQEITHSFVASGASTTIAFSFRQDPHLWVLDDVNLSGPGVVPEPATLALLGLGLAGLGFSRRRTS